jgi:hypothetical protein
MAAEAAWTASDRICPLRLKSIWTLNVDAGAGKHGLDLVAWLDPLMTESMLATNQ